jgi:cytochrome c-type biogenesis protein CcmH
MIDFWLAAGLLLLVALSFLLIPVLRSRRAQLEEDRTALNVALYQERVAGVTDSAGRGGARRRANGCRPRRSGP